MQICSASLGMWSEMALGPQAVAGVALGRGADFRVDTVFQGITLTQDLKRWECELGIKTETFRFLEDTNCLE